MRTILVSLTVFASAVSVRGDVFSSDFNSFPIEEGWQLVQQFCEPETWLDNGWYVQQLDNDPCPPPPDGGQDAYTRSIDEFNGSPTFFYEYRVQTDGDRSEIPGGAPTVLVVFNSFGMDYTATVSRDQIKFFRDVLEPILFFDITSGVPHTIRLELFNDPPPATYRWYVDGVVFDEGLAEGPYPVQDATLTWVGFSWFLPCENRWNYIRYGVIPVDGSGDFDSDGAVDDNDLFFFEECLDNSGENVDAGPGCRWADFDAETDVDCDDWNAFSAAWTALNDPTTPAACRVPIPATSTWGMVVMTLCVWIGGTIVIRRQFPSRVLQPARP